MKFDLFICLFFAILLIIIINNNFFVVNLMGIEEEDNWKKVDFDKTLTRAFCSGQTCQDFLVTCFGSEVVGLEPISGFVTFGSEWVDRREKRELC